MVGARSDGGKARRGLRVDISIELVSGSLAWILANIAYFDLKRRGQRGVLRFLAFWAGLPGTFLVAALLPEGKPRPLLPGGESPAEVDALLAEIREDRRLRDGSEGGSLGPSVPDSPSLGGNLDAPNPERGADP
jgi:hypothetical protein